MNPYRHSQSSVNRWGGSIEDYLPIHELIDSPKASMNNNAARALTHNTWFAYTIVPRIFGYNIKNSAGKSVDVVDIAMLHIAEDFMMRFVPTAQDYLQHLEVQPWMCNGVKMPDNDDCKETAKQLISKLNKQNNGRND